MDRAEAMREACKSEVWRLAKADGRVNACLLENAIRALPLPASEPDSPSVPEGMFNGYDRATAERAYQRVIAWLDWADADESTPRPPFCADDVRTALALATPRPKPPTSTVSEGVRYRHKARGTTYEVIGTAELQAGQPQYEHAALVIYRGEDGKLWARNSGEFHDGRFEPLIAAAEGERTPPHTGEGA